MSHGIQDYDRGFATGHSMWHGMPQYINVGDRFVEYDEAAAAIGFPMDIVPLHRFVQRDGVEIAEQVEGANCIVRTDHDIVLAPHVGDRYDLTGGNLAMLERIKAALLDPFPDLGIESVGSLFNGASAFISLKVGDWRIKGDQSNVVTSLLYTHRVGWSAYVACCHSTRVVCNNTLKAAKAQGAANDTLRKFTHTSSSGDKVAAYLKELAEIKLGLEEHKKELEYLITVPFLSAYHEQFLETFLPLPVVDGRGMTLAENRRYEFARALTRTQNTLDNGAKTSRYALLQAYTDWTDHSNLGRGDSAGAAFDGLVGARSSQKQAVLDYLLN